MPKDPKCPYCEAPLFPGDIADFELQEVQSDKGIIWMLWCRHCGRLLSAFPTKSQVRRVR